MKRVLSLMILATSALIAQPESYVPSNMSFQGLLTNPDGSIYDDGEYDITFKIFVTPDTGYETTIWQEVHSVNVSNGVFSTYLGSINNFPNNLSSEAMLEIQVGNTILSPRQPFSSVPFAFKSQTSSMSLQSQHADYADSSSFSSFSQHSETASFAENIDLSQLNSVSIAFYEEFYATDPGNAEFTVLDTIFSSGVLKEYLQGIINYNGQACTEVYFAPTSEMYPGEGGLINQSSYDFRKYKFEGSDYYNSSLLYAPQSSFFFYLKPEYSNVEMRLLVKYCYNNQGVSGYFYGKVWGR